ncbi:Sec-independent protein translocase protein TatB [Sphingomonas oryzagri]
MFDIAPSELLIVAVVAIVFIGPKDLPRVMRVVGQWVGKGRSMARHFRSAMDEMIRESELAEMEAKWKAENERIMREHADLISGTTAPAEALPAAAATPAVAHHETSQQPEPPLEPAAPVRQPPEV